MSTFIVGTWVRAITIMILIEKVIDAGNRSSVSSANRNKLMYSDDGEWLH